MEITVARPIRASEAVFSRITWFSLILLGMSGNIAWSVENQFFNLFMYNAITPDPRPIAWMVAATAVVNSITAILMGTLNDRLRTRWGRRKPFLVFGYIAWGICTALYPISAVFHNIGTAIALAILFDCIMTFFGASANDVAFHAYVTDLTTVRNRGKVTGVLQIISWVAVLLVFAGAPILIERTSYRLFFTLVGTLVFLVGITAFWVVKEPPFTEVVTNTYWQDLKDIFHYNSLRKNKVFMLLLLAVILFAIAQNISTPYYLIYMQHYIKLSASEYGLALGISTLIGGLILAYPIGLLVDKIGRARVAVIALIAAFMAYFMFSLAKGMISIPLSMTLLISAQTGWIIATYSWTKDLFPPEKRAQFAGLYMFAYVLVPQTLGPAIGSWISTHYGYSIILNGQSGLVPPPLLFQVTSVITFLVLIPLLAAVRQMVKEKSTIG